MTARPRRFIIPRLPFQIPLRWGEGRANGAALRGVGRGRINGRLGDSESSQGRWSSGGMRRTGGVGRPDKWRRWYHGSGTRGLRFVAAGTCTAGAGRRGHGSRFARRLIGESGTSPRGWAGEGGREGFEEFGIGGRRGDGRFHVVLFLDQVEQAQRRAPREFGRQDGRSGRSQFVDQARPGSFEFARQRRSGSRKLAWQSRPRGLEFPMRGGSRSIESKQAWSLKSG